MKLFAIPALLYNRMFPGKVDESFGLLEKLNLKTEIGKGDWQGLEDKMSNLSPNEFSRVLIKF